MLDKTKATEQITITPPNMKRATVRIKGVTPYVMNKMSSDNRRAMMETQEAGHQAKKGKKRAAKDFDKVYKSAMHISSKGGWYGIPASGLRKALVDACRIVGYQMTKAKLAVFVVADGIDADDGTPLVKLVGKPTRRDLAVKLANGSTDITARPFFDEWHADVTLEWDADMFSASDVVNLLSRVGRQVGIGAGRHNSSNSTGMGWGEFRVEA